MTGRRVPVAVVLVVLALLLATVVAVERRVSAPAEGPGPGVLTVVGGRDPSGARQAEIDTWNARARARNAAAGEQQVPLARLVELPATPGEQLAEMLRLAQSTDDADRVDVFVLDAPWTRQFAQAGYVLPLGEGIDTSDFLAGPLRTGEVDGERYALPFNTDVGLLFSHGPAPGGIPNWGALGGPAAGEFAAAYGGQFGAGEAFVVNVLEGLLAHGAVLQDAQGRFGLGHPSVGDAVRRLREDMRPGRGVLHPLAIGWGDDATAVAFAERRMRYMRNWPVHALPDRAADLGADVRVVPLPWRSVLGGQNLAVAARSSDPAAARRLIAELTSPDAQKNLFRAAGYAPTRASVYVDRLLARDFPQAPLPAMRDAVEGAFRRPDAVNYPLFSRTFEQVMRPLLTGDADRGPSAAEVAAVDRALDGRLAATP